MKGSLKVSSKDVSSVGQELSSEELTAVHGGELKIEVPAYVPLSQSNPKTEPVVPRVPYK